MSDPSWVRLSRRGQESSKPETLYEGIPAHLRHQLGAWYSRWLDDEMRNEIELRFRLDLRFYPGEKTLEQAFDELVTSQVELYLDVIDLMLWILDERAGLPTPPGQLTRNSEEYGSAPQQLELMLSRAGSAWRVATDGRSLQRRVFETAVEAFVAAAPPGTEAAHHLAAAWQAAYGRSPNASVAYREAVRAVEAVATLLVEPNNTKATLGTVLRTLRDQSDRWELAILGANRVPGDIAPLLSMLELLWQGHSDRHAPITPIPAEAAPMAVHLAITLVQWFESGSVRWRTAES